MRFDHRAITREICQRSYYDFLKRAWDIVEPSREYVDNWHIEYLCNIAEDEIRRIAEGRPKTYDYIVNMPFRSGKSHIFSVFLQPWAWINYPWMRFTNLSYSSGLSMNHSNKSQKLMLSDWYQDHFGDIFALKSTARSKEKLKETEGYFENNHGGFRFVSSIQGAATGFGGDVNVADDILKAQDVISEAIRNKANDFWQTKYPSRVSDFSRSVFFLIMQRLHDDDPAGNSLQRQAQSDIKKYFHINIPGEDIGNVKPKALKSFYKGGLFFPERFGRKELDILKSESGIGLRSYMAQVNQHPRKMGGNLFQDNWFPGINVEDLPPRQHFEIICRYFDTAYTENEKNSATAYVELGLFKGYVYVLGYDFRWLEFPEQIKWMAEYDGPIKIEAKATGKSAGQSLRRAGISAIELEIPHTDKRSRANAISFHTESKRVIILNHLRDGFLNDIQQGILKYPEGSHDDLGDAFVLGITDLLGLPTHLDRENIDNILDTEYSHVYK